MKAAVILVSILTCSFALLTVDWSKIKPRHAFVTPSSNGTKPLPGITGGRESIPNSRPYQAALIADNQHFCGGSVVSANYVLTAAHCLEDVSKVQVILGAHDVKIREATQVILESTSFIIHTDYNSTNLNYDIGLVRLPEPIQLNQFILQIPLASNGTFDDVQAIASGWGDLSSNQGDVTSTLHEVDLSVITNEVCATTYSDVQNYTLCTSGAGGVGICHGDSGGPLVANNELIGISSFTAVSGCQLGYPSGFIRVTALRSWIMEHSDVE